MDRNGKSKYFLIAFVVVIIVFVGFITTFGGQKINKVTAVPAIKSENASQIETVPLAIDYMRSQSYPGSEPTIEQTLTDGSNYKRYIASYLSEGLKIYGLLTVPKGKMPDGGFPVIIFNHGYIPPETYQTTARYVAYVDGFARAGYVVFKPDYRGHGISEGKPEGAYYSPAYTIDVLNALGSVKKLAYVNTNKIGMWGHSMGGNLSLRSAVIDPSDIKAEVIWGGVVGSYNDLMNNWQRKVAFRPSVKELANRNNNRKEYVDRYGTPSANPGFWNTIDPTAHLDLISAPILLVTGGNDEEVPVAFSTELTDKLTAAGKTVEYLNLPGGDHNISGANFSPAMKASVAFFDKYLK